MRLPLFYSHSFKRKDIRMKQWKKRTGRIIVTMALCLAVTASAPAKIISRAADTEKVMQSKYKIIQEGDIVDYSNCYVYQEVWETKTLPVLTPSVKYTVTDAYRYDRTQRKRIMELTAADGTKQQISIKDIAFVSAATGGKVSDFENGHGLTPVASVADVTEWKFTLKNPYHEKNNPQGVREPKITNIKKQGDCIVFDYEDLYSTGNSYLSAVVYNKNKSEVIAYDRLVYAYERGNGTVAIHWPREYDKNNYVLEVFAEKYNGDGMTDYISDMRMVYRGVDTKWENDA